MATTTKTKRTKAKSTKTKVAAESRPESGAEKRTAAVDPFDTSGVAPNAAPKAKNGDNVYKADTDTAKLIDEFVTANSALKKAKAIADAAKGKVMAWAKGLFAAQYVEDGSRPKNPTLQGRTTAPKFIVSDSEVNVDADKFATLQDLFGDNADDTVTTRESFAFNADFLADADQKARITKALLTGFSPDEVKEMIVATVKRTTKKGSIDRVLGLLGDDADAGNVELALEILTKAPSIK